MPEFASPFDFEEIPDEPPRGTVLAYQITFYPSLSDQRLKKGPVKTYDYVSFRAGNGEWYTTGRMGRDAGPENWNEFWNRLHSRGVVGEIRYATAWGLLEVTAQPEADEEFGGIFEGDE
jgi:hypothetical protein